MTQLTDYQNKYRNIAFERRDGILEMRVHTKGGSLQWGADPGAIHTQLTHAFRDIAHDRENKVLILTGTGESFCKDRNLDEYKEQKFSPDYWYALTREGSDMVMNMLNIDIPVISAINGPALVHSEVPVLADMVIASEDTCFQDTHMSIGVVPGDGCHAIWNMLLGHSRGHYFLMTSEILTSQAAMQFGVIHEIVAKDKLRERAWEIATVLASKPINTLRYSRILFTQPIKELMQRELGFGFALEGLSVGALAGGPSIGKK